MPLPADKILSLPFTVAEWRQMAAACVIAERRVERADPKRGQKYAEIAMAIACETGKDE